MNKYVRWFLAGLLITVLGVTGCKKEEETAAADDNADAVSSASVVAAAEDFIRAAGEDGTWIIAITEDLSIDEEITLAGQFTRRDEIARKIALYAQDEDRNITDRYTLSAPRLIVRSENARIQGGTFNGDVYVEADGFHIVDGTVNGDVVFASEEYRSSFSLQDGAEVTGELLVE